MTNVHEIKRVPLTNAPQKLRELADDLEKEGREPAVIVIVGELEYEDSVQVFGYGHRVSYLEMLGWLSLATNYSNSMGRASR